MSAITQPPVTVASTGWTPIIASGYHRNLQICETAQAATADYYIAAPTVADGPVHVPAGASRTISAREGSVYSPGSVVCYLKLVTAGSTTFDVIEF